MAEINNKTNDNTVIPRGKTHEILPATESDCPELAEVEAHAFLEGPVSTVIFGLPTPEKISTRGKQIAEYMAEGDPELQMTKVVIDGKIAAFAIWYFRVDGKWPGEPKEEEGDGEKKVPDVANVEAFEEYMGFIHDVRKRRVGGIPHALLSVLVCRPEFQRRGAGAALMRHGLDIADESNVPAWLEASQAGYSLYKSFGFEDIEWKDTDLTKYGGEGSVRAIGMFKPNKDRSVTRPNECE